VTTRAWLQCNIGLTGEGAHRSGVAHELFSRLLPTLDREGDEPAGAARITGRWFFQRKPPDIRLRIACEADDASGADRSEIAVAVDSVLARAAHDRLVRESFWSTYEPEVDRFGGSVAMDVAHDHFTTDAQVWRAVDHALRDAAAASADETELRHRLDVVFVVAASALVRRVAADPEHERGVWTGLGQLTAEPSIAPRALLTAAERRDPRHAVRDWLSTHASVVDDLLERRAERSYEALARLDPSTDRNAFAALLVHFDANRWGVDGGGQRWMADTMLAASNPAWP